MFRHKFKPNGSIDQYKARLVAKGFHQRVGIDFHKMFSLVIKIATICLLLSIAISHKWFSQQLDISNAFLHRDLHELIYMKQPQGFKHP